MQEMWVCSLGWEDPLEKEMTTHSNILTWRIHGQRNLAGYSPRGYKRVRHNLAAKRQQRLSKAAGQIFSTPWMLY